MQLAFLKKISKTCLKPWSVFVSDVNECEKIIGGVVSKGGCQHKCNNTIGSYICLCNKGYFLAADERTCEGT